MNELSKELTVSIRSQRKTIDVLVITLDDGINRVPRGFVEQGLPLNFAKFYAKDSFMWLGKALKFLGNENPYPESTNPSNKDVAASTDVTEDKPLFLEVEDPIIWIKSARQYVDDIEAQVKHNLAYMETLPGFKFYHLSVEQAWIKINDCKHQLGLALRAAHDGEERVPEKGPIDNGEELKDKPDLTEDTGAASMTASPGGVPAPGANEELNTAPAPLAGEDLTQGPSLDASAGKTEEVAQTNGEEKTDTEKLPPPPAPAKQASPKKKK